MRFGARVLLTLAVSTVLSGCAGVYITSTYATATNKVVRTSCRGEYKVSEKDSKLLVSAYALSEMVHSACAEPEASTTGVPFEYAAVQYLAETNRSQCRITTGERLEALHSEFTFVCPPAPAAKPGPAQPRT
jgi:hypothetical protein